MIKTRYENLKTGVENIFFEFIYSLQNTKNQN